MRSITGAFSMMRRYWPNLLAAVLVAAFSAQARAQEEQPEYSVKAAVIHKIARFVQWPSDSFHQTASGFQICVLGDDPFGSHLKNLVGKKVHGRRIDVREVSTFRAPPADCNVLFISRSEQHRIEEVTGALQGRPVLTVGDTRRFCNRGGMVNLVDDGSRLRFQINSTAVRQAGLIMDAQLLELATIIAADVKA